MVGSSDDSFCRGDNGECRGRRDGSGYEPRAELGMPFRKRKRAQSVVKIPLVKHQHIIRPMQRRTPVEKRFDEKPKEVPPRHNEKHVLLSRKAKDVC